MVDAADSKSAELTLVRVRVPPSVPDNITPCVPERTVEPGPAPCAGQRVGRAAACVVALASFVVGAVAPLAAHAAPPDAEPKPTASEVADAAPAGAASADFATDIDRRAPRVAPSTRWQLAADVRLRGWAGSDVEQLGGLEGNHGAAYRARLAALAEHGSSSALVELQGVGHFGGAASSARSPLVGLQQAVIAWDGGATGLRLEAGRLKLRYGAGRHVSDFDFDAQGHAFDGGRLQWQPAEGLQVDVLGVRLRSQGASAEGSGVGLQGGRRNLLGAYAHARPVAPLDADLYLLALDDHGSGRRVLTQTMGMRLGWRAPRLLTLDAEAAAQVGAGDGSEVASEGHLAWMAGMRLRLRGEAALRFEAGLMFDVWSGDADPTDGVDGTWRPLYGDRDRMVGALQRFEVSNLQVLGAFAEFGLRQRWLLKAEARLFARRAASDDPSSAEALGWRAAGTEIDLHFRWNATAIIAVEALLAAFLPSQAPTDPSGGGRGPAIERVGAATAMMLQLRAQL